MGREAWMPKEQDGSRTVRQPICVKTHLRNALIRALKIEPVTVELNVSRCDAYPVDLTG